MSLFRTRNVVLFVVVVGIVAVMVVAGRSQSLFATDENAPNLGKRGETDFPTPHPPVTPFLPSDLATVEPPAQAAEPTRPAPPPPPTRTHAPDDPYVVRKVVDRIPVTARSVEWSSLVVRGRVTHVGPARWTTEDGARPADPWSPDNVDFIFTPVSVAVLSTLKGEAAVGSELTLMALTGQVGKDYYRQSGDFYVFSTGQEVVLFLSPLYEQVPLRTLDGQPLWQMRERYTLDASGNAYNYYKKMSASQLFAEIEAALATPDPATRTPIPVTVLPMGTPSSFDPIETPNPTQIASQRLAGEMYYAFYEQPGTVIAEGTNTTPVKGTTLGITLTSYRITEVVLAAPVTWDVTAPSPDSGLLTSQPLTLNRLWRIEIIGEVFLGSGAWTIWIDNQAVGLGRTIERGLETVMFDDKYLREGAVLAVEYGGVRGGIREEVPERLHLLNR
jgi:hypothetical protein